jgi:uncharacterized membrane protein YidH (DUF202 family)
MDEPRHQSAVQPGENVAPRRTMLAAERTQLAWWRTGFAALAVGVAIGKIIPHLSGEESLWSYTLLGAAFGLYGLMLIVQGSHRRKQVEAAVRAGGDIETSPLADRLLTGGAVALGLATTTMIIFD